MRKTIFLIVIALLLISPLFLSAQSVVKDSEPYKRNKEIYLRAIRYNDVAVARDALYNLISIDPNDISLLDSLAFMYFDYQKYASAVFVCNDILARRPEYLIALEMRAVSYENLRLTDKALEDYESLYLKNNDVSTLYKIAFLQFERQRYNEAKTSSEIILKDSKAGTLKVIFNTKDNKQQEVPVSAAILNLLGLIKKQTGNKAEARQHFEEALKVMPEFELAKENIQNIDK